MPPQYKLYTQEASFRGFMTLIAAEYNDIHVQVVTTDVTAAASTKSPVGKLPVLETPSGKIIFSSYAAARYIANLRSDTGLMGTSLEEAASVDAWMDWAAQDLELPACVWFYPVVGYIPFHKTSYEKAKKEFGTALQILDVNLIGKTYLVGNHLTLADIVVASTLLYPFKLVADQNYLKPYGNVTRWFQACVSQSEFVKVVGKVAICQTELKVVGRSDGNKENVSKKQSKGGPKAKKQPEQDKHHEPEKAVSKKPEHPYKVMDKESPSPFHLDAWKKMYSNSKDSEDTMSKFWEMFDCDGWSLWLQEYKYNQDNKRIFMCSNAIAGFQQRTDEIRRWGFGVMHVLGTEEALLEIKGVWLLRGDTIEHMIHSNDDANWYEWTKLAGKDLQPSDQVKKTVADYWFEEDELDGKPIQDIKVFK